MVVQEALLFLRTRWGLHRFLVLCIAVAAVALPVCQHPVFYKSLLNGGNSTAAGLLLYLSMYGITVASFSRIFKFKVFLLGHLYLIAGLLYLYLTRLAFDPSSSFLSLLPLKKLSEGIALHILTAFMSFNLLIAAASPASLRYRQTRLIAVLILVFETAFFFIVLYNFDSTPATSIFTYGSGFLTALYLVNLGAVALTILLVKEENSLGGVIAALCIVNLLIGHSLESSHHVLADALFLSLPVLFGGSVVLYWFSCLHHRVAYDPLLKIYNREYAHNILSGMSHINLGRTYCVAMVDIDHFKAVNDNFGHATGDTVLHGTAQCIKHYSMPSGVTCRYGGEEIIVFFRNTKESDAHAACEEIRRQVRRLKYVSQGRELSVSVSIGLTECDDPGVPVDRVVKSADEALYKAKETGRNKVLIGRIKKRLNDPNRPTYQFIKATGADRRKEGESRGN